MKHSNQPGGEHNGEFRTPQEAPQRDLHKHKEEAGGMEERLEVHEHCEV
jgi:hypothetical protein